MFVNKDQSLIDVSSLTKKVATKEINIKTNTEMDKKSILFMQLLTKLFLRMISISSIHGLY